MIQHCPPRVARLLGLVSPSRSPRCCRAPARGRGGPRSCCASGPAQELDSIEPVHHRSSCRRTRRSSSTTTCSSSFGRTSKSAPRVRRHVGAVRRRQDVDVPHPRRHEVVGRRGRRRPRTSASATGLAMAAIKDDGNIGIGLPRPGLKDAGVTKVECPDDATFIAYTDRPVRPHPPDLHPDPAGAHLRQGRLQDDRRRRKFDPPIVGTRPVHRRRVEDRRSSPGSSATRNYWGKQGFADEVIIQLLHERRHDGPGAQVGRDRLRPRRQPGPVQRSCDRPDVHGVAGSVERLDAARVQHLRDRDREDDPGRRPVDQGPAGPGLPRRARLRHRQARRSSTGCWAATATSARRNVPPVLGDRATSSPTTSRTFDIELAKQKLDAAGYALDAQRQAARQGRQADQPPPRHARARVDTTRSPRSSSQDWFGQLGIDVTTQSLRQRHARPTWCCRPRRTRRHRELRHRPVGLGRATPTPTRCSRSSAATRSAARSDSQYCNPEYDELYDQQNDGGRRRGAQGDPRRDAEDVLRPGAVPRPVLRR